MTDRELMQQALDALMRLEQDTFHPAKVFPYKPAIIALRARLAQPEPEPVAWTYQHEDTGLTMCVLTQQVEPGFEKNNPRWQKSTPLYTAPPQREWQGLTDEEIREVVGVTSADSDWNVTIVHKWIRAIEAKLKEKNT